MVTLPKTLGSSIDKLSRVRTERLAYKKKMEAELGRMRENEHHLQSHILKALGAAKLAKASGRFATASRSVTYVPTVDDWAALYKHIKKTDEFDLLQRRPNVGAFRDRWEDKKDVPGVRPESLVTLSITTSKK